MKLDPLGQHLRIQLHPVRQLSSILKRCRDIPRCSALRRWVVAGVEGRLATKISHRPRNFLKDRGSVVEYQSVGRDPSTSPVPGTMYYHQSPSCLFTEDTV